MKNRPLTPYERWMVKSNIENAKTQGVLNIVEQLRDNGYPRIADEVIRQRLEHLRTELRAERISFGELFELSLLAEYIPADDVELREAAGLEEGGAK